VAAHPDRSRPVHPHPGGSSHAPKRPTPAEEINVQYAAFTTAFNNVLFYYVQSLTTPSNGTVPVSATVTALYTNPNPIIQVSDAAVFGPPGTYAKPVTATASFAGVPFGTLILNGSSGNNLIINVAQSHVLNLPVGTVLSAFVPTSATTSAMAIFPSYITNSTIQLATNLVRYFNNIPMKLPPKNAPPHTPVQSGAIQSYVYQNIAGSMATSLQQLLLAIPLPTTPGPDLQIYQSSVESAIAESHQQVLNGIMQIFSRRLYINALSPANRLGENFNSSSGSSTSGASSTSGSSATPG